MADPTPFGGSEMHFITRVAPMAALGAGLMAGAASPALAVTGVPAIGGPPGAGARAAVGTPPRVAVEPDPAAPGEPVRVLDRGQCSVTTSTASSMAFSAPAALRPSGGQHAGRTSIRSGALGTYPVTVACGRMEVSGSVRIVRKARPVASRRGPGHRAKAISPKGPAATGDGTTAGGYDSTMAKAGLAVAGVGAVVGLAARIRRSRSRS